MNKKKSECYHMILKKMLPVFENRGRFSIRLFLVKMKWRKKKTGMKKMKYEIKIRDRLEHNMELLQKSALKEQRDQSDRTSVSLFVAILRLYIYVFYPIK